MTRNKDRLYVGLHFRSASAPIKMPDREDTYHWSFIIGPKHETRKSAVGHRAHAKNIFTGAAGGEQWVFEECPTTLDAANQLLVRVMIAKVRDRERLIRTLGTVDVVQGDKNFNCVSWLREALAVLQRSNANKDADNDKTRSAADRVLGSCELDWKTVRDAAMGYCQKKKDQNRFNNKGNFDVKNLRPPTFDLLQMKETAV